MPRSQSVLRRGARTVTLKELTTVPAPPAGRMYYPQSHATVVAKVKAMLKKYGYSIAKAQHGLSRNNARYFGTLDLTTPMLEGVAFIIGVESSSNRSSPLAFCAGYRLLNCNTTVFTAEMMVRRRHMPGSIALFRDEIDQAVNRLSEYRDLETTRIERMRATEISQEVAESYLLKLFERGVIPIRGLRRAIDEWRHPSFEDIKPPTFWSFLTAVTAVLGETAQLDLHRHVTRTIRLTTMLSQDPRLN